MNYDKMISFGSLSLITLVTSYWFNYETAGYISIILFVTYMLNNLYKNMDELKKYYKLFFMIKDIGFKFDNEVNNDAELIGNCLKIHYKYKGINYNVFLPFNRKFTKKIECKEVFVKGGDVDIRITQQPGVPIVIYPAMLNGDRFSIIDESEEETVVEGETEFLDC